VIERLGRVGDDPDLTVGCCEDAPQFEGAVAVLVHDENGPGRHR
jgi:hypothetical protein